MNGKVVAIYICPIAGGLMREIQDVVALEGKGFYGDRYCTGEGSFNKGKIGNRQVTLINGIFFNGSGFTYGQSRRNLITEGIELMRLIGQKFQIGEKAIFEGVKYCYPCPRPGELSGKKGFQEAFSDRGGLVAQVNRGGVIKMNDQIFWPPKEDY